jgi:hypothetical protein
MVPIDRFFRWVKHPVSKIDVETNVTSNKFIFRATYGSSILQHFYSVENDTRIVWSDI